MPAIVRRANTAAARRVRRRRTVQVDALDVGPGHVRGLLDAVDEDQQSGVPVAEITAPLEVELLAAREDHAREPSTMLLRRGGHDRGDQLEGDGVVHTLGRSVERLDRLGLVEVVNEPPGEASAGGRGDAASERAPRQEVAVGGAASDPTAGVEVDALESVPGNQHPAVARILDVDPAVAVSDIVGAP